MISKTILTILNMIIILSYCRANGDLPNEEEINKNCVASLKMIGFKYDSGFVNYCHGMQFHKKMRRHIVGNEIERILNDEKNKDETFKKMTKEEWKVIVQVVVMYYYQFLIIPFDIEIKTPEQFCIEELEGTSCFMGFFYKLKCTKQILQKYDTVKKEILQKYDKQILQNYDKLDRYKNVKITYNELGWNENMSEEEMNYFIDHLPNDSKKQQYFKYLGKLILKYNKALSNFVVKTWCQVHYGKIHHQSKDSTLANEENEDNGTD